MALRTIASQTSTANYHQYGRRQDQQHTATDHHRTELTSQPNLAQDINTREISTARQKSTQPAHSNAGGKTTQHATQNPQKTHRRSYFPTQLRRIAASTEYKSNKLFSDPRTLNINRHPSSYHDVAVLMFFIYRHYFYGVDRSFS